MTTATVNYKDALMDSIYEAGIPASQERVFDFVMMTIEAAARLEKRRDDKRYHNPPLCIRTFAMGI